MSSSKSPSRRPKLMRASVTCPLLATSNASRKDLASRQSCGATSILTRVASYSTAQNEHAMSSSPHSSCSTPGPRSPDGSGLEARKEPFEIAIQQCQLHQRQAVRYGPSTDSCRWELLQLSKLRGFSGLPGERGEDRRTARERRAISMMLIPWWNGSYILHTFR
jgi:hypothetical protein